MLELLAILAGHLLARGSVLGAVLIKLLLEIEAVLVALLGVDRG